MHLLREGCLPSSQFKKGALLIVLFPHFGRAQHPPEGLWYGNTGGLHFSFLLFFSYMGILPHPSTTGATWTSCSRMGNNNLLRML